MEAEEEGRGRGIVRERGEENGEEKDQNAEIEKLKKQISTLKSKCSELESRKNQLNDDRTEKIENIRKSFNRSSKAKKKLSQCIYKTVPTIINKVETFFLGYFDKLIF
jgi:predicted  nucleic acid-binding Zn-ribbon protein